MRKSTLKQRRIAAFVLSDALDVCGLGPLKDPILGDDHQRVMVDGDRTVFFDRYTQTRIIATIYFHPGGCRATVDIPTLRQMVKEGSQQLFHVEDIEPEIQDLDITAPITLELSTTNAIERAAAIEGQPQQRIHRRRCGPPPKVNCCIRPRRRAIT